MKYLVVSVSVALAPERLQQIPLLSLRMSRQAHLIALLRNSYWSFW